MTPEAFRDSRRRVYKVLRLNNKYDEHSSKPYSLVLFLGPYVDLLSNND